MDLVTLAHKPEETCKQGCLPCEPYVGSFTCKHHLRLNVASEGQTLRDFVVTLGNFPISAEDALCELNGYSACLSPEDEQSILFETLRPNRLFSEPTLQQRDLHMVVPASLLFFL